MSHTLSIPLAHKPSYLSHPKEAWWAAVTDLWRSSEPIPGRQEVTQTKTILIDWTSRVELFGTKFQTSRKYHLTSVCFHILRSSSDSLCRYVHEILPSWTETGKKYLWNFLSVWMLERMNTVNNPFLWPESSDLHWLRKLKTT